MTPSLLVVLGVALLALLFRPIAGVLARLAVWLGGEEMEPRVVTGVEAMVEQRGVARSELAPSGKVKVRGELWHAVAVAGRVECGQEVEVVAVEGLVLKVRSLPPFA